MPNSDELCERYQYDEAAMRLARAANRAHVRVNFITGADGAVSYRGQSGELGGETDRAVMSVLRAASDAVLVSAGTVRAEGYGGLSIPAQLLERRRATAVTEGAYPRIVIASNALSLDASMPVFTGAERRPLIVTSRHAAARSGAQFRDVADVLAVGDDVLDLAGALRCLAELGLHRVLCEGGPQLFGSLLAADLVDEVCLTVAPIFTAGSAGRIATSHSEVFRRFALRAHFADPEGYLLTRYARR